MLKGRYKGAKLSLSLRPVMTAMGEWPTWVGGVFVPIEDILIHMWAEDSSIEVPLENNPEDEYIPINEFKRD